MREDLTEYGVEEVRTPQECVDRILSEGTVMMVVNSVCGCAAGKRALRASVWPCSMG
jgi:putative YphP/YqiW family bacilliredoxin